MRGRQQSIADRLANDARPVAVWAIAMRRLVPCVYDQDPDLSRTLAAVFDRLESAAADLICIGMNDPAAPVVGAATRDVLQYLFRRWPEDRAEFYRVVARADQILSRRRLVEVVSIK